MISIFKHLIFFRPKKKQSLPLDISEQFASIYLETKPFTMTSFERMYALYSATAYIEKNNIEGDIVECGVWRGGSAMVIAMKLMQMGSVNRKMYLYDTYEGMA